MIKTRDLRRHLRANGCHQLREGSNHSVWQGPGGRSTLPRHREIPRTTARAICDQLGVTPIA